MLQERKQELKKKQTADGVLLKKIGLDIDLVSEHEDDIKLAKLLAHKKGMAIIWYLLNCKFQNIYYLYRT